MSFIWNNLLDVSRNTPVSLDSQMGSFIFQQLHSVEKKGLQVHLNFWFFVIPEEATMGFVSRVLWKD